MLQPSLPKSFRYSHWAAFAVLAICALPEAAVAQGMDPTIRAGSTEQVAEHVYIIPDESRPLVPLVGFVVGSEATLVIDPGLGMENGQIVLSEARLLAPDNKLFVAATHTHPEHDLGSIAFPEDAEVVRSMAQEQDIEEFGMGLAERFATFSERTAELLEGAYIRETDRSFQGQLTLDLGGVEVQLLEAGPAHTLGDMAFWVESEGVLFTGDVVMNEFPNPISPTSSVERWLERLDELEALSPTLVLPCHYGTGGIEMIDAYRQYFLAVKKQTHALADQGMEREQIMDAVQEEVAAMFSDWHDPRRIRAAVNVVLRERGE